MVEINQETTHGNIGLEKVLRELAQGTPNVVTKRATLLGGTTNDPGDYDGSGNPYTLFTVTGDVQVYVFGVVKTTLTGGSSTISVGVTGATAAIIALTTATTMVVNEGWLAAAPSLAVAVAPVYNVIGGGLDIIQTTATANVTAGVIDYYCYWKALSTDGNVVAA